MEAETKTDGPLEPDIKVLAKGSVSRAGNVCEDTVKEKGFLGLGIIFWAGGKINGGEELSRMIRANVTR